MLKLVVMSDLHLVPEGEVSATLDTAARLAAAVERVVERHADADLCILAGDLADRGEAAAYARLAPLLAPLPMPVHMMLGNHDDRPTFLAVMGPGSADPNGFVQQAVDVKGHRIVMLDTSEPGKVGGVLCAARLGWLADRLAEARDRPVIILMHHHANPLSLPVDAIALENPGALVSALKTHPDIRQVIAGHVHVTTTALWHGLPFTTLAGGHYSVGLKLPGWDGAQAFLEGPGQFAVVLADEVGCTVHFENFIDRHIPIARANLRPRPATA
ncbi:MAG: phosphodiesterase [Gemmobacter sp.]